MSKPNILFSVPTAKSVSAETVLALTSISYDERITYAQSKGAPVEWVRNTLARMCLDGNYTHLMMMDSDIVPPENIVELLLECDHPMAAAIVPIYIAGKIVSNVRIEIDGAEVFMERCPSDKPFLVKAAGTGCVLIAREVFERIPWPWFEYHEEFDGTRIGEDIDFSMKAAKYGLQYMAHPKALCGHIKEVNLLDIVKKHNENKELPVSWEPA